MIELLAVSVGPSKIYGIVFFKLISLSIQLVSINGGSRVSFVFTVGILGFTISFDMFNHPLYK